MIDKQKLEQINSSINEYADTIKSYSNDIVGTHTKVLDEIMKDIKNQIVDAIQVDDNLLEHYFVELTNALYFIGSKIEELGIYDDISKLNFKVAYNQAYSDNQVKDVGNTKKQTVADNQMAGENGSINEQIMNIVYSRSFKIIKTKIDAGYEMVRTLSKIISSRQQEKQLTMISDKNKL